METGIGKRVKNRRIELGLTQLELAKRMGFSNKSTISKVEAGLEDNMTIERAARYAKALECDPSWLLGWEENFNEDSGELLAEMITDSFFWEYAKKLFYADARTKAQVYSLIDFALSNK